MIRSKLQRLLPDSVSDLRPRSDSVPLYECRSCGTKLEAEQDACPACGSEEIARYDLS
jgi:predicted RNA-binding Zn-ribbon protein involved in translation (DUF1610 family)